jgi:3-hydroxyisobutyrate dehydrogenase-like beta-hydroxyacid dehydrogenase
MPTVGLLHPGAMGATLARGLAGAELLWCPDGRSDATRRRAEAVRLTPYAFDALKAAAGVVISICPPAAAEDVARSLAGFGGTFVDANAVSPMRKAQLGAPFGERFVDGSVIGGAGGPVRLYLAGERADEVAALFTGDVTAVDLGPEIGRASRLKMAYAHYQKGSRALAAASHALVADSDLAGHLLAEGERIRAAALARPGELPGVAARAWRWGPEMLEIADTLEADGLPGGLARGAADAFARWRDDKDAELSLAEALAHLRT